MSDSNANLMRNPADGREGDRAVKTLLSLLLILVVTAAPNGAQESPGGARLTLQAALDLADKQNLDLAAARQRRFVSRAGVQIAKQRPNPAFGFTALRDTPHEGLFFDQPLELGGKRGHRIDVARQEGGVTDVEISTVARQVRRSTREAFYRLAFARAESDRLAQVVKLAERLKQIAQQRFEAGAVPQLEVVQADVEESRVQADLEVARQEEKVTLSQFNALLNEPAATGWDLAGRLEDPPLAWSVEELVQRAYAANAELQHLAQEEKVEASRRGLLKAERIPNLDLQYGLDFNSPHDFAVGPRGQLSLTLPIFSRNQGEIAQSLANQRVLEAETAAKKRAVAAVVEEAYFDWNAQQTQAGIYRQTLVPAVRKLEGMAEESYRAGKATILVVLDAQRNVQDVERTYQQGLLALQSAFASLEEAVGAPLDQK
jgi:outer membrane protein, heavy metal efflux system